MSGWVFGDPVDWMLNRDFVDLLLRHSIEVRELAEAVTVDGRTFEPGSAWVVPSSQPMHLLARSVFERTEAFPDSVFYDASTWTLSLAYGIADAEVRGGLPETGSRLTGPPVSSYEAGQLWHLLDQRIGMPVTKVDVGDIGGIDWSRYDVLVLVSGSLGFLEGARLDELRGWIRRGGTLVAIRGVAAWAARNGLTPNVAAPGVGRILHETEPDSVVRRDYERAGDLSGAQQIGGSIWAAGLDLTHPLGWGYTRRLLPVWRDYSYFFEPSANAYGTVARLVEDPHLSGYASDENHARLPGSPSVLADQLGGGSVLLLVDNPNFRGYWRGTQRLFLNALFFGDHVRAP